MEASCAQIIGLIMLVNTNLAIIISFATPYWQIRPLGFGNDGLWAKCAGEECRWVFDDDFFLQKLLPGKKSGMRVDLDVDKLIMFRK